MIIWYQHNKIDILRRVEIRDILPLGKKIPLIFQDNLRMVEFAFTDYPSISSIDQSARKRSHINSKKIGVQRNERLLCIDEFIN